MHAGSMYVVSIVLALLILQAIFNEAPEEVTCQFYVNNNKKLPESSNKKLLLAAGPHNYIDPRVLPCLHTFCKEYVGGLAKESEKQV